MINLLGFIPGSSLFKGLIVAAVVAATVGAVGYAVHSYNDSLREEGRAEVRAEVVKADFTRSEKALEASQAYRVKENGFRVSLQRIQNDLVKEKAAGAVAAAAVADGLRKLEAALASNRTASADSGPTGGVDDPRDGIISQCAAAAAVLDAGVKRLASEKAALQAFTSKLLLAP